MTTQRYSVTPHPVETLRDGEIPAYDDFLEQRRKLMARKIRKYFEGL